MTVDNSYVLFYGTAGAATTFGGSDFSWPSAETYNFTLDSSQYLYVVTASDLSVAQGFLGQFENLSSGFKFYSNDSAWQVAATGLGPNAPYTGSAANLSLLTQQIAVANNGADLWRLDCIDSRPCERWRAVGNDCRHRFGRALGVVQQQW